MVYWETHHTKSIQGFSQSLSKELQYLRAILNEPCELTVNGIRILLSPPKSIKIADSLFQRSYSCLDYPRCQICCHGFVTFLLSSLLTKEQVQLVSQYTKCVEVECNGVESEFLAIDNRQQPEQKCQFSCEEGCKIHTFNPVSCTFPLIKFVYINECLYIRKAYYGRNWLIKCPVVFHPYPSIDQFFEDTLWKFDKLIAYADSLKIDHKGRWLKKQIENRAYSFFRKRGVGSGLRPY